MKKLFILFILLIGMDFLVFSLSESWLNIGFEHGSFFESASVQGNTEESYIGSLGINISSYMFWDNKNVGFLIHGIFAIPITPIVKVDYIYFQNGFIYGVGFRHQFNEKLFLKYGVGLNLMVPQSLSGVDINLGIGGDIGLKYDITNTIFFTIGSIFTIDFANYKILTIRRMIFGIDHGWANNYYMIGLRPYISIGINWQRNT